MSFARLPAMFQPFVIAETILALGARGQPVSQDDVAKALSLSPVETDNLARSFSVVVDSLVAAKLVARRLDRVVTMPGAFSVIEEAFFQPLEAQGLEIVREKVVYR